MLKPVIVLGAGGHTKVLVDMLLSKSMEVIGIADKTSVTLGQKVLGVPVLGSEDVVRNHTPDQIRLVNGLGSTHNTRLRADIFRRFKEQGYSFATVAHPAAVIARDVTLAEGAQVMAGAVIQPGCVIGVNTIINTGAKIDHDCYIGAHVHIAPGATLSGGIVIEDSVHVGTGATVIQGVRLGAGSVVGAGTLVLTDIAAGATVVGVPAKEVHS